MTSLRNLAVFCKAELLKLCNLVDPVSFLTFLLLSTRSRETLKGKNAIKG